MTPLIKKQPALEHMSHALFMEQISPIMESHGVEERPSVIDADQLCLIMRDYFTIYYPEIEHPSFAIFSLSDGTVKFEASSNSRCFMSNLLTIFVNCI